MKLPRELGDLPFGDSLTATDGALETEGHYDGLLFEGLSLEAANADHARFVECAFSDVTLDDVALRKSRLSDVWLRDVRLLSADLAGSSWLDGWFTGLAGGRGPGPCRQLPAGRVLGRQARLVELPRRHPDRRHVRPLPAA